MKSCFIGLILFFSANSFAQFTSIPDSSFEQALIDLGHDTLPIDGFIPTANINLLLSLDISSKGISDLAGIEAFSALTQLDCGHNQLTSLDLSHNSALTMIWCVYNQLTCLNVKNDNNINFTLFHTYQNPGLLCIQVDDIAYSTSNWTAAGGFYLDSTASFNTNCSDFCNVAVEEAKQNNFLIYPNPASTHFTIKGPNKPYRMYIYSSLGKLLYREDSSGTSETVDISMYNRGLLIVKIEWEGKVYCHKVLNE